MSMSIPERNLALELIRVTETAAIAAAPWVGRGEKNLADQAAVEAMRLMINTVDMNGVVVIGEGEKDQAPMLHNGELVGNQQGPNCDVAVDPIDGTSLTANGMNGAISVIALAPRGTMFQPGSSFYMNKIVTGPEAARDIDLRASAAENIYVDKASLVGSIGVIMNGFGVTGLMEKLGIERRAITAGKNKALLDPFSKQDPKQKEFVQGMISEVHEQFIKVVRDGRGDRLKETPDMFTGLVWNGAKSVEIGLSDGLRSVDGVARDVFKASTIVDYTMKDNLAERVAKRFGAAMGEGATRVLMYGGQMR